jgi:hypothetical protein
MKKIHVFFLLVLLTFPVIAQSSVTVIAPNGGENWIIGCPSTIQWINSTPVPVKIELYKNGMFYMTICPLVPATQNSYIWTPPYSVTPGNTFKVKVTVLSSNTANFDFSDGNFSINLGALTVVSPNGGETWQIGSTHQILWTDNICENVRIELWKGSILNTVIAASVPSTGLFSWTIPGSNTIVPGTDYKIRIQSIGMNSGTTNLVYDLSDANFTIGAGCITVLVPNGGEVWIRGTTHIITWINCIAENVRIELWKGGVYNSLISASTPGTGSCYWAIPSSQQSGIDYKVKIISLGPNTNTNFDFSDNNFTILGANAVPLVKMSASAESSGNDIKLFPNPCNNHLQVSIPDNNASVLSIEMMNMNGKIVLQNVVQGSRDNENHELNTASLADGMYIFVVRKDREIIFRNVVFVNHR